MIIELAGCVIPDADGRILLIHRDDDGLAQWELPGGKIELSETPGQAAARELKEELGVEVEVYGKLGETEFRQRDQSYHYFWMLARIKRGRLHLKETGHNDFGRFSKDELKLKEDISPNVRNLLKKIIDGEIHLSV